MMNTDTNTGWGTEDLSQTDSKGIDAFPNEWKDEFEGLLFLGKLEKEVDRIPYHKFVVRTLTINEKLEVSLLAKPFIETIGYGRAYKASVVAAGLVSVDGRDMVPLSKGINVIRQKYDYIINNWYDTVIDILYQEIETLETKVIIILEQLGIIEPLIPNSVFEQTEEEKDTPKGGE
jgi:hypothetical protein